MESLWRDVRYGFRSLARAPGLTAVMVATIALGIGANTAIFSVTNAVLFRPLPAREAERLVIPLAMQGPDPFGISAIDFEEWRKQELLFDGLGVGQILSHNVTGDTEPERVAATAIDAEFLPTVCIMPILGRNFVPEETRGSATALVVILSHGIWQRRFGGDPHVLGRILRLDGRDHAVVGVMPPDFDLPLRSQLWTPFSLDTVPTELRGSKRLTAIARVRAGVSLDQAEKRLQSIALQLAEEYPASHAGWSVRLISLRASLLDDFEGRVRTGLVALLGAVAFLLVIACANLGNLLLGRALGREQEMAVRLALGAPRSRLVRQLATECALPLVAGALLGLLLAFWVTPLLVQFSPIRTSAFSSHLLDVALDPRVLLFTVGATVITGLLFTVGPAWRASRTDKVGSLNWKAARITLGPGTRRIMNFAVIGQVALTLALLTAAGIMSRSLAHLQQMPLGFQPAGALTMQLSLTPAQYPQYPQRLAFFEQLLERVRHLPGVRAAGLSTNVPLTPNSWDSRYECEGRPASSASELLITADRLVSAGYLEALGVPLLAGRTISPWDTAESEPVAVITETLANSCWPGQDPIGKRVRRISSGLPTHWMTVVGMVKSVREDRGALRRDRPVWYLPLAQTPNTRHAYLVIRSETDAGSQAANIRREIWSVDPLLPVSGPHPLESYLHELVHPDRFAAFVMLSFALAGLSLAALGIFGLLSYVTTQRTREIGIRMAFGARRGQVLGMVVRHGLGLACMGIGLGVAAAWLVSRYLSTFVQDSQGVSWLAGIGALFALVTVALLATAIPAYHAARVDPLVALRHK